MGDNDLGQCGHPTTQSYISEPTRITQSGLDTVIVRDIAAGFKNSFLATNRGLFVFGNNPNGVLGVGNTNQHGQCTYPPHPGQCGSVAFSNTLYPMIGQPGQLRITTPSTCGDKTEMVSSG